MRPHSAAIAVALGVLLVAFGPASAHAARCDNQSSATFDGGFTSRANLVVGPLSMIGAGRLTPQETVHTFGGNKFPLIVRAGHTVTVRVARRSRPFASLFYGVGGGVLTETEVADGRRAITFRACSARKSWSEADGDPVTFWSGFVLVSHPMCVRLKVWIDTRPGPRRAGIPLGRRCR